MAKKFLRTIAQPGPDGAGVSMWSNRDIKAHEEKLAREANRMERRPQVQEMDIDDVPEEFFDDSDEDML